MNENGSRQRLAWVLLLSSFFICGAVAIALPYGGNLFRQRSQRGLDVSVLANQGTLAMVGADGSTEALLASEQARGITQLPIELITNSADSGLIQIFDTSNESLIARVQMYGNTIADVEHASTPRFSSSNGAQIVDFSLSTGRIRVVVPPATDRQRNVNINTQQGTVAIREAGQYAIEVNNTNTELIVISGNATLVSPNGELNLVPDQRGVIRNEQSPIGPFSSERNLIRNGDFKDSFSDWIPSTSWDLELDDQPEGETSVVDVFDESVLRFRREGIGHVENSVRQIIDRDIVDFSSVRLELALRINNQSLPVCGSLGTECPLTIRIEYDDERGSSAWQQGVYGTGEPSDVAPNFCIICGPPLNLTEHWQAPRMGELVVYESGNLLERMAQEGIRPIRIKNIIIIVSGHSFEVEVVEIALIATEGQVEEANWPRPTE